MDRIDSEISKEDLVVLRRFNCWISLATPGKWSLDVVNVWSYPRPRHTMENKLRDAVDREVWGNLVCCAADPRTAQWDWRRSSLDKIAKQSYCTLVALALRWIWQIFLWWRISVVLRLFEVVIFLRIADVNLEVFFTVVLIWADIRG